MSYPVKLSLYKNGHLFEERIAENDDDLYCSIEMDTGTGWLDAAGLYQILLDKGWERAVKSYNVCHSYEKWGELQQEVVEITVRLQRMDGSGRHQVSAVGLLLGVISAVGCGTAASVTVLAVGICSIWLVMFFMAFLSTLSVLFYVIFILAGLAVLALVFMTYLIMYAAAGTVAVNVFNSVARIGKQSVLSVRFRVIGAIAAALSVPPFFLVVQAVASHWRIGDFNELLTNLFGQSFPAMELSSWGWKAWLNLTAGIGIAFAAAWSDAVAAEDKAAKGYEGEGESSSSNLVIDTE